MTFPNVLEKKRITTIHNSEIVKDYIEITVKSPNNIDEIDVFHVYVKDIPELVKLLTETKGRVEIIQD